METIFILFSCDQWFSKDSMRIIGDTAYLSIVNVIDVAYEHYQENMDDDVYVKMDTEDIELDKAQFMTFLKSEKQISKNGCNYLIEKLTLK